jgi:hypothetical protein
MPVDEFFRTEGNTKFVDNMAAILDVPSYKIRVVEYREGSTIIQF